MTAGRRPGASIPAKALSTFVGKIPKPRRRKTAGLSSFRSHRALDPDVAFP
jgi:hypothetical protein